jgi:hypothetical protein
MQTDEDRFTFLPLLFAIFTLFLLGWLSSYPALVMLLLVWGLALAAPVLIAVMALLPILVNSVRRKRWRRLASWTTLPIVLAATIAMPNLVLGFFGRIGDYLHFLANKSSYDAEVAALPSESHLRIFDWGGWAGINTFLIYDGTDQIALPTGYRESGNLFDQCAGHVVHITGHYYRCNPP